MQLLSPSDNAQLSAKQPIRFQWQAVKDAIAYKLEIKQNSTVVLSALLTPTQTSYIAPSWLNEKTQQLLQWQVQAILAVSAEQRGKDRSVLTNSRVQKFQIRRD